MTRRYYEDPYGQVDGEGEALFASSLKAAPWLGGVQAPWHMWGSLERVRIDNPSPSGPSATLFATQQLSKVTYKRPDSWHFLFTMQLVQATPLSPGGLVSVSVNFNVTVGLGRGSTTLRNFATLGVVWDLGDDAPLNLPVWTTTTSAGPRFPGDTVPNIVEHVTAEDIQVEGVCRLLTSTPQAVVMEIGSYWSPKTHVRPDWMQLDVPTEAQFPGDELRGK